MDYPLLVFAVSLAGLWLSAQAGSWLRGRRAGLQKEQQEDLGVIVAASLTLLGLIIGFAFSMAVTRYDDRKKCEEVEANAIGTEYLRAGLLPSGDAARVRELLARYLDQRILFYNSRGERRVREIESAQSKLQAELWSATESAAATGNSSPVTALAVAGMNQVIDSQGFSQAASWNRIPIAAWALMATIAVFSNGLFGFSVRCPHSRPRLVMFLPAVVSIALCLIADLDSPRGGVIRVNALNLQSARRGLSSQSPGLPPASGIIP